MNLTPIYLCSQSNATHVKYTSAQPFTPKFVKDHLTRDTKTNTITNTTKKLPSYRAQALYDERVHRRQLGLLARRIQSQRTEKKKGAVKVKREKMGRREAAEMGVWRLRKEEARCVRCDQKPEPEPEHFGSLLVFGFFRWDAFVPLHWLWLGYMSELLGLTAAVNTLGQGQGQGLEQGQTLAMKAASAMPSAAGMHAKLVKADFHGSIMTGRSFFLIPFVLDFLVDAGGAGMYDDAKRYLQCAEVKMPRWWVCPVSLCKRRRIRSRL